MKLVVGLGNPGSRYQATRHNAGFMVSDSLQQKSEPQTPYHSRFNGLFSQFSLDEHKVGLLKPQTYMNRSGQSVVQAVGQLQIAPEDLIVIHDDLDLSFGVIRVKVGGGSGGHRGLRSCFAELDTKEFVRIRFGIGRPEAGADTVEYVLDDFDENQREELPAIIKRAAEAAQETVRAGAATAMNQFNRRKAEGGEP